jgi:integrase
MKPPLKPIDMAGIEELPSGHFRLRIQIARRPIRGTFATAQEAADMRDAAKREIADESMTPVDGHSVLSLGPAFLKRREGNRGISTERTRWTSHVASAAFAPHPVETVVRRDILDWLDELKTKLTSHKWGKRAKTPLSLQTRRHCLNLLRKFFVWAIDREYILANPASDVIVEREDGDEEDGYQEGWYLDANDQREFLASWDDLASPKRRLEKWIVAFALATGLRHGELRCLHLKDVMLDGPEPHVVVHYGSYDAKQKRFRSPKGKKGEKKSRVVPLWGPGLEAATAWMASLSAYAKHNPLGLMFPTERGKLRGRSKTPRSWNAVVASFRSIPRLGRRIWWHLLRHTTASSMIAGWWGRRWSLDDTRAIMGHSSVTVTERYAHLAGSVIHQLGAQAQAAWTASCHAVATPTTKPLQKAGRMAVAAGLRSRMSGVRITPGVPAQTPVAVATAVATGVALLQRFADGGEVTDREWVDATCALIESVPATIAAEESGAPRGRR